MASIYDTNFQDLYQKYRNKQRLAGGQIDPGVVGSLAEADLNARYTDQKSRRAQELQEKAINNSYDIANRQLANSLSIANKQADAQKSAGMYSALASLPTMALTGYKLGNELGLWGGNTSSSTPTSLYNYGTGSTDFASPSGQTGDVDSGYTWNYDNVDWSQQAAQQDTSWLDSITKFFEGWF